MLLANFIQESLVIGGGIRPLISAKAVVTHDDSDQVAYQPNGAYHIKVKVRAGENAQHHDIGFAEMGKDSFQTALTNRSLAAQTFTLYFPFDRDLVFQLDEEHRRHSGESVFVEVEWHLGARKSTQGTVQQLDMYQVDYVPNPSEGRKYPLLVISPLKWNDILKAFGWPQRRLVEIRFSQVASGRWPDAVTEITAAEQSYESRQDPGTLLACERAFEKILGTSAVTGSQQALKNAFSSMLSSISNPQKQDTVAEMLSWVTLYVRRMKHTQPTTPSHPLFDVDSGDAELGLILSKAALSYISRL